MPLRPMTLFACLALVVALAVLAVPLTLPSGPSPDGGGFERRLRAYILAHPEVILDSVNALQRRETAQQAEAQRRAVVALRDELAASPLVPVAGNPDGDVTVVEFFDYRCPYCRQAVPQVKALLAGDGKIRLVRKEFPVLGRDSVFASRVAVAAALQGKYPEVHEALMTNPGELTEAAALAAAERVGLDLARLKTDMEGAQVGGLIQGNLTLARRLAISGTPTFIVGDEIFPGFATTAELQAAVGRARRRR